MKTLRLPSGPSVPVLGQGTWGMGDKRATRSAEAAALRAGIDLGMTLIDTAEMYGEGGAEKAIAEAIEGRRNEVFIVSKVYPHNASKIGTVRACERSLQRLETDYLDLYLLHWRGSVPLAETLEAFDNLRTAGKIRDYGVSNFDQSDMEEAMSLPGGAEVATNQVLYSLKHRGIEWDLLPWCRARNIPIMAYSPIEQGALLNNRQIKLVSSRLGATPAQVALAWVLRMDGVIAIPKSGNIAHLRENIGALGVNLTDEDLADLDRAFPPPTKKTRLATS
ncbi:MAG TPA: aldo/keto reductase [Blastocatellia bacterium]|nr:aldo/keto reductase [Blastocatellia bacterium]